MITAENKIMLGVSVAGHLSCTTIVVHSSIMKMGEELMINRIFYWLTTVTVWLVDWFLQSRQWLRLHNWFFHCLMSLWPERCLLAYHNTYNAFFMDLPVPSSVLNSFFLRTSVDSVLAHNDTMVKATQLIFSLFDVTLAWEMPFGIPQYI